MIIDVAKVFFPSTVAFAVGIIVAPLLTRILYEKRMWKTRAKETAPDGRGTPLFNALHKDRETRVPKMGGVVIWGSAVITLSVFWLLAKLFPGTLTEKLTFLSRNQTWLPLATLLVGSLVGLLDDYLDVRGGGGNLAGGLSLRKRLVLIAATGAVVGWWFFTKLGVTSVIVPFVGDLGIGSLIIPLFVAVMLLVYSGGVIDGLDGLAGGVFASIFAAYGGIAFFQNQIDLAAFCAVIVGGILAFLWFNIPPARFFMSETGTMGLTLTLAVVAFLTRSVAVLPLIAFPLIATTASVVLQLGSKKWRNGKKIFLISPLHHHFEAIGWPAYKVTMRYWVLSILLAVIGMIVQLVGSSSHVF